MNVVLAYIFGRDRTGESKIIRMVLGVAIVEQVNTEFWLSMLKLCLTGGSVTVVFTYNLIDMHIVCGYCFCIE